MVLAFAALRRYNTRLIGSVSTERTTDRAWVEVDLGNLVANARTVLRATPDAALLPMVKADAYGLGVSGVVGALESLEPWGYGVATPREGADLRALGVVRPVVVFTPATATQLPVCREHDLRPVLDDPHLIAEWNRPYHCEVDTGMGRAGIRWDDDDALAVVTRHLPEGVFTHLHSADASPESVDEQLHRFHRALDRLNARPPLLHVANSSGAFRVPVGWDLVRPGIFLYGGAAGSDAPEPKPVVSVRAAIVSRRVLREGETVSYGAEWTASRRTTVGTLSIGYADGLPRSVQGRAVVLVDGVRRPIVGRVTMDMIMVDLGDQSTAGVGDVATLIGADGTDRITLDECAGWAATISYEILTRLGPRLPRVYGGP